jgi:site-specific DNA-adenine methylase
MKKFINKKIYDSYDSLATMKQAYIVNCYMAIQASCKIVPFECNGPGFVKSIVYDELRGETNE